MVLTNVSYIFQDFRLFFLFFLAALHLNWIYHFVLHPVHSHIAKCQWPKLNKWTVSDKDSGYSGAQGLYSRNLSVPMVTEYTKVIHHLIFKAASKSCNVKCDRNQCLSRPTCFREKKQIFSSFKKATKNLRKKDTKSGKNSFIWFVKLSTSIRNQNLNLFDQHMHFLFV